MKTVINNTKDLLFFDKKIIQRLQKLANKSEKKRSRICCHLSTRNKINEMVIYLKKKSYVRPHIHPSNKSESYTVLKGRMKIFVFNKFGKVKKIIEMGDISSGKNFFYRMSNSFWHMPIAIDTDCIYHETYCGPFIKNKDVKYAPWAPQENDTKKTKIFLDKLRI